MPVQALRLQPVQHPAHRQLIAHRSLALDRDMDRRVQAWVRQPHPRTLMIVDDRIQSLTLVRREPPSGLGCKKRVVGFHLMARRPLVQLP